MPSPEFGFVALVGIDASETTVAPVSEKSVPSRRRAAATRTPVLELTGATLETGADTPAVMEGFGPGMAPDCVGQCLEDRGIPLANDGVEGGGFFDVPTICPPLIVVAGNLKSLDKLAADFSKEVDECMEAAPSLNVGEPDAILLNCDEHVEKINDVSDPLCEQQIVDTIDHILEEKSDLPAEAPGINRATTSRPNTNLQPAPKGWSLEHSQKLIRGNRKPTSEVRLSFSKIDGDVVVIPETELDQGWDYTLIGYFTGRFFPGLGVVHSICKSWRVHYSLKSHDSGWLLFKLHQNRQNVDVEENVSVF